MADWTGLAGASGLAAALEEIQGRRIKEAQLQRELTSGQGEWLPSQGGMGGPLGFFDALFGYNKPGQIGFGGQRYDFKPYDPVTAEQAKAWGMTYPETITTPERLNELPTGFQGPPELIPAQETTRDVPIPGIVGMRLGPKEKMALFQEQLKERRELAKLDREQKFWQQLRAGQSSGTGTTSDGTFALDGTGATGTAGPKGTAQPAATPAAAPPVAVGPVPGVEKLSPQFRAKAQLIANRLGVNLDDFYRVMSFETGGEFSPATRNRMESGATGLIQFMPDTAKGLGTTTDALAKMTPEQQLDYVEKYLAPHKGRIGNLKDLYMAILYPAAVGKSEDTVLFTPDKTPKAYLQNAGLDTGKKGYVTVGDAVAAVQRTTGIEPTATAKTPSAPAPGGTPAGAPAQTPAQPNISNQVAGPGAPGPGAGTSTTTTGTGTAASTPATTPTTTPTTTPAAGTPPPLTPQEPFALSAEGRATIARNNQQTQVINAKLQKLRADQEVVLSSRLAGTPRGTVELDRIKTQITELEKDKNKLLEASTTLHEKELDAYRKAGAKTGELGEKEGLQIRADERKPTVAAATEAAKQNVEFSEDYRQIARELFAAGDLEEHDPTKLSAADQARLSEEKRLRDTESERVKNFSPNAREAYYRIRQAENIRPGRANNDVFDRALQLGREQDARETQAKAAFEAAAKSNEKLGDNAKQMYRLDTVEPPSGEMTRAEAEAAGYRYLDPKQVSTLRSARRSMMEIHRQNVMLFGGKDDEAGTLTGTPFGDFIGIYPALEKARGKDVSGIPERFKATIDLRMQYLTGKNIGEWAEAYTRRKEATLAMIGRQIGGDTGHFTDADARRADGNYARLFSRRFGIGPFDPTPIDGKTQAQKQMRLLVSGINDTVRASIGLDTKDPLPWDETARFREHWRPRALPKAASATPQPARGTIATQPAGAGATAPAPGPAAPTPTAQEQAPAPPAPGQAPKKLDGPTAQRLLDQAVEELFPGRTDLSEADVAQARARARVLWQQQGG